MHRDRQLAAHGRTVVDDQHARPAGRQLGDGVLHVAIGRGAWRWRGAVDTAQARGRGRVLAPMRRLGQQALLDHPVQSGQQVHGERSLQQVVVAAHLVVASTDLHHRTGLRQPAQGVGDLGASAGGHVDHGNVVFAGPAAWRQLEAVLIVTGVAQHDFHQALQLMAQSEIGHPVERPGIQGRTSRMTHLGHAPAGAQVLRKRHARSLLMTQRLQRPHVYHRFYLHTALDRQATSGKLATNCEIEDQVFSSTWRSLSAAKLRRNLYAIGSIW